jgi:hypothetical protein
MDHNGPLGFGAEQMAPSNSLQYPGQSDFTLQTAWPNAWESMSTFVDGIMSFLDVTADAIGNTLSVRPKLPTGWSEMAFNNLQVGTHRVNILAREFSRGAEQVFTNTTGGTLGLSTVIRLPANAPVCSVTRNGSGVPYSYNAALGQVRVDTTISGAQVVIRVQTSPAADINLDGGVDGADLSIMLSTFGSAQPTFSNGDLNGDGLVDGADLSILLAGFGQICS